LKVIPYQQVVENPVTDPEARDAFIRVLIGPEDGARKFHLRRFRVLAGGYTPLHTHPWEHEVYILAGSGELVLPDGPKPFTPGDAIFVDPGLRHQFRNTGADELVFLCAIPA
jgi:quercetin dioxygenase-like cupin family protein